MAISVTLLFLFAGIFGRTPAANQRLEDASGVRYNVDISDEHASAASAAITCPDGWYEKAGKCMYNCTKGKPETLCNNLGHCDTTTSMCTCQDTAVPTNGTCVSAAGQCGTCTNGQCRYNTTSSSVYCSCNAGYNISGDTCFKNTCGVCSNGTCVPDSTTQTMVCNCNEGYKLSNNFCYLDLCVDCTHGNCLVDGNTSALKCYCNSHYKPVENTCYYDDCVICNGGKCVTHSLNKTISCSCDNGAIPYNGICGLNKSQLAMAIAIPIVFGLLILAIIAGIIAAVCIRKRKREDPMNKEQAQAFTAFSGVSTMQSSRY